MAKQYWRSRKIIALVPPSDSEDSELESEDDEEERRIFSRDYFRNESNGSSPVRNNAWPAIYDLLEDLSDCEDPEQELSQVGINIDQESLLSVSSSQVRSTNLPPCVVPETPSTSSIGSPLTPGIATRRTRQDINTEPSPMPPPPTEPVSRKRKMQRLEFSFKKTKYTGTVEVDTSVSFAERIELESPQQYFKKFFSNDLLDRKRKMQRLEFSFKKTKYTGTVEVDTSVSFAERIELESPQQYFKKFFSNDLLDFIVDMTNLYSVQQQGKSICVTRKEIEIVLGIEIIMGIVKMPAIEDYWSNDLRFEPIASSMGIKRFRCIKRYLHFCDNTNVNKNDSYHKVSAVMEHVRQQCLKIEEERSFAIDEMIIPYKGKKAGNRRQYNPQKPHKWGFKFQVRAGTSGMVYDFFAYDGANTFQNVKFTDWEEDYLGVGGKTVVRLCNSISNPALCTVYFDNWFTSLELIYYLRHERGILSLGTIRKDRLRNCQLSSDKNMKKKGRGTYEVVCDNAKRLAVTVYLFFNKFLQLDGKKFDFTFIGDICHDDFNLISTADEDLAWLLEALDKRRVFEDTLVIVMGDHGARVSNVRKTYQGRLEERLPFMAIMLPEKLKKLRPYALKALKQNKNVLTTPFDIHSTVLDVLDLKDKSNKYKIMSGALPRAMTLLEPIPKTRTCPEAGIVQCWCSCTKWSNVSHAEMYNKVAFALAEFIDNISDEQRSKCARRQLVTIKWVLQLVVNNEVLTHGYIIEGDKYLGKPLFKPPRAVKEYYQAKIILSPGRAIFEGTLAYNTQTNSFTISEKDISRVTKYGNEPNCISATHPHLNPFCYCVQYLKSTLINI